MTALIVEKALKKLGNDINIARRKRKLSSQDFAERIGVTRQTVSRLEKGDPGIKMETFLGALHALGELHRITELLDVSKDDTGMLMDIRRLPERVHSKQSKKKENEGTGPVDPKGLAF